MEQTLVIVKPDAVARGLIGEVIRRFEAEGLVVCGLKMVWLAQKEAEGFYQVHRHRPFFESLTCFMASGPCVMMVLEGEKAIGRVRTLMGATDPAKADEGTLRRSFATSIEKNVVHGSDSTVSAAFEISYFFNRLEIIPVAERGEISPA
ncbi:MAG: nucleoside-diphosphate kinase [candidate division NC10 bacterium]|nr:nucleoside-diphosphate kinase [candidate division NC10 bacterium]